MNRVQLAYTLARDLYAALNRQIDAEHPAPASTASKEEHEAWVKAVEAAELAHGLASVLSAGRVAQANLLAWAHGEALRVAGNPTDYAIADRLFAPPYSNDQATARRRLDIAMQMAGPVEPTAEIRCARCGDNRRRTLGREPACKLCLDAGSLTVVVRQRRAASMTIVVRNADDSVEDGVVTFSGWYGGWVCSLSESLEGVITAEDAGKVLDAIAAL